MSRHLRLARAAGAIALAACVTFALSPAASAAGNDWNHRWGHDGGGWNHNGGWHDHDSGSFGIYLGGPGYYSPPPTYYYPPPAYYAPPPTYYYQPQPSFGLQFNVH
jgi:hypothetical protein